MADLTYIAPDRRGLRRFGFTMALIFSGLLGVLLPLVRHRALSEWPRWPHYFAAPFLLLALGAPMLLGPIHQAWMRIGLALGWVNTRILLSIVFFVLVTPLALIRRLLGRDPLGLRLERKRAGSYRVPSEPLPPERMKEPF